MQTQQEDTLAAASIPRPGDLEISKAPPSYVARQTFNITPIDLNVELPAGNTNLLLNYLTRMFTDYARFTRIEDAVTIAAWVASTWFVEPTEQGMVNGHPLFEAFGKLFLIGPKGSGKNRVAKIARALVRNPTVIGSGIVTDYGVRNALEAGKTVIIDEYHKRVGTTGKAQKNLQELVLAYSREEGSIDGRGGQYNEHDIFGPMMLLAQPSILTGIQGTALEDLFDRSFIITMEHHDDPYDVIPDLDEGFEAKADDLRRVLELWASAVYESMLAGKRSKKYTPIHSIPRELTGRNREIAVPLLFVSDIAVDPALVQEKGRDTYWAERVRNCVMLLLLGHGNNSSSIMDRLVAMFGEQE
jgi:hypothetical protein